MTRRVPIQIHIPKTGGKTINCTFGLGDVIHRVAAHPNIKRRVERAHAPYVFTFLRCPVDRAISAFFFAKQFGNRIPDRKLYQKQRHTGLLFMHVLLSGFIDVNQFYEGADLRRIKYFFTHFSSQTKFVVGVDFAIHFYSFSNFSKEAARLAETLGRELPNKLPSCNRSKRPRLDARDILSTKSIERIKNAYEEDFRLLDRAGFEHLLS